MTSMYGTDPSFDIRQTYDIKDLRGDLPIPVVHPNTILSVLISGHDEFVKILTLLPDIIALLNDTQSTWTIFVPYSIPIITDSYKARQFVLRHILPRALSYPFLRSTKAMLLDTKLNGTRILVENDMNTTFLNKCSRVLDQQIVGKSVLYGIDIPLR